MFAFAGKRPAGAEPATGARPPPERRAKAAPPPANDLWTRLSLSTPARGPFVQPKLLVGESDHPLEREADRAADSVLAGTAPSPAEPALTESAAPPHAAAPESFESALPRGGGSPLSSATRASLEPRFGADFRDVRVHEGTRSAALNQRIGARAFTFGRDVFFGAGASPSDRGLLAHELAHVVQQTGPHGQRAPASPTVQRQPAANPTAAEVATLTKDLQDLIAKATWPAIRAVEYPKNSAAAYQRAKDRRAGTVADLTGIGARVNADRFAAAAKSLQADWSKLTAKERAKRLFDAANVELKAAGAFELKAFDVVKMVPRGEFDPSTWKLSLQKATLENASPSNDDIAEITDTALHEARHCEQHFLAARFEGAQPKKLAADVMKSQGIPGDVAIAAVQREKLGSNGLKGAELVRAENMFNSLVRDEATNAATTGAVSTAIEALDKKNLAAQAALKALTASATAKTYADGIAARDDLAAQKKAVEVAYGKYRAIPHEADAHEVGNTADVAYKAIP